MPARFLREGILDSDSVNLLSWPAEVFYRRLMSAVDDYGRFDARPAMLRSKLYPLKLASVSEADVSSWMAECLRAGLVSQYIVADKPYLLFLKLGEPRAKTSKYPAPPNGTHADENICLQTRADAPPSPSPSPSPSPLSLGRGRGERELEEDQEEKPKSSEEQAVGVFCELWSQKYGAKYNYRPKTEGPKIAGLLGQVDGDLERFRLIVQLFIADSSSFRVGDSGHPIHRLDTHFGSYQSELAKASKRKQRQQPKRVEREPPPSEEEQAKAKALLDQFRKGIGWKVE